MTVIPITCDNCGAKYKLPETFTGTQAKCQKCGSVIDVQKQRGATEAPAEAKPAAAAKPAVARPAAAARPAVDRSSKDKEPAKPAAAAGAGKAARSERTSARKGRGSDGEGGDDKPHGRERGKKNNNTAMLAMAGIGLVAIVVVVVVMMGKGKQPEQNNTAKVDPKTAQPEQPAAKPEAAKPETPKAEAAKTEAAKAEAAKADTPKADTPKTTDTPKPAAKPADAPPVEDTTPAADKRPWQKQRNPPQTMAEVTDPKSYGEVQWPAEIDEATKKKIQGFALEAVGDGIRSVRAKRSLEETGYGAMFGVVEQLRLLDYKDSNASMIAFDLNKLMERITGGLNARFEPVEAGESLVPAKAEWNAKSVKGWLDLLAKFPDSGAFKKDKAERLKKQAADDK